MALLFLKDRLWTSEMVPSYLHSSSLYNMESVPAICAACFIALCACRWRELRENLFKCRAPHQCLNLWRRLSLLKQNDRHSEETGDIFIWQHLEEERFVCVWIFLQYTAVRDQSWVCDLYARAAEYKSECDVLSVSGAANCSGSYTIAVDFICAVK